MDITTTLGLVLGFGAILAGQALEGGHASSIMAGPAALIVFGGTFGCVFVGYPLKDVIASFTKGLKLAFGNPKILDPAETIAMLCDMAKTARRDGLLALDDKVAEVDNEFMVTGVRHMVDGVDGTILREIMESDMDHREHELVVTAKFWEAAGGFSPTIGIVGAVLGLIHTMENLDDPSKIGAGIATAFVATVYGVGAANLIFLPVGTKIKRKVELMMSADEMVMEGLLAVQAGHNSHVIEARLAHYAHGSKKHGDKEAAKEPAAAAS